MNAKIKTDIEWLVNLAMWLDGLSKGQGHLDPLGTRCVENLWTAIKELRAYKRDSEYIEKQFKKIEKIKDTK